MINGISVFSYVYLPFVYIFFYRGVCSDLYFILIILFIFVFGYAMGRVRS